MKIRNLLLVAASLGMLAGCGDKNPDQSLISISNTEGNGGGQSQTEPCSHDYEMTMTEPTCVKGRETTYVCKDCGYSYKETGNPLGHETGRFFDDDNHWFCCRRCGEETSVQAHDYIDGVCSCGHSPVTDDMKDKLIFEYNYSDCSFTLTYASSAIGPNVVIPSKYRNHPVRTIAPEVFKDFRRLESILIPSSVRTIGREAFLNCVRLTSVSLSSSIASIGYGAFEGCTSLTSIEIPYGLTRIESNVFKSCSLTSITIPSSVSVIDDAAFGFCLFTSIIIPDSVTSIGKKAFEGCSDLTSLVIPSSVMFIGQGAFNRCISLASVTLNLALNCTIENEIFYLCVALTSITIPKKVVQLGAYVFSSCTHLTHIYCEASSKPRGWDENWNGKCDASVSWGATI